MHTYKSYLASHKQPNILSLLLLAAILTLAAYLRLAAIPFNPIDLEQSFLLRLATQLVNSGRWPGAANQSFSGITQPPLILFCGIAFFRLQYVG